MLVGKKKKEISDSTRPIGQEHLNKKISKSQDIVYLLCLEICLEKLEQKNKEKNKTRRNVIVCFLKTLEF